MIPFLRFAQELGITLEPGQQELCRVSFDGEQPDTTLAQALFGCSYVPPEALAIALWVIGARSGKTFMAALRALHLGMTVPLPNLAVGEDAVVPFVAPDMDTSKHTLNFVRGFVHANPALFRCRVNETDEHIVLVRPDTGQRIKFRAFAASRGGRSVRGRTMPAAVLEEAALFMDRSYKINDMEIYNAVQPRIVQGGQLLVISTPWAETGMVYDFYRESFGKPGLRLVAHAPTERMRTDPHILAMVSRGRHTDPHNATREYDARFMGTGASRFFDARAVEAAVDSKLVLPLRHREPPECLTEAGGDFGFERNSSALAVVQRDAKAYTLAYLEEQRPTDGPLVPSQVVAGFVAPIRAYGLSGVIADAHYRQAIVEHLLSHGLALIPAEEGAAAKAKQYVSLRTVMHSGELRIPRHDKLIQQLKEVHSKPLAGGGLSIRSPEWASGEHGDLVSALVLAVDRLTRYKFAEADVPGPKPGTRAHADEWARKRKAKLIQEYEKREQERDYYAQIGWYDGDD